jgi:hypothetical protein
MAGTPQALTLMAMSTATSTTLEMGMEASELALVTRGGVGLDFLPRLVLGAISRNGKRTLIECARTKGDVAANRTSSTPSHRTTTALQRHDSSRDRPPRIPRTQTTLASVTCLSTLEHRYIFRFTIPSIFPDTRLVFTTLIRCSKEALSILDILFWLWLFDHSRVPSCIPSTTSVKVASSSAAYCVLSNHSRKSK